MSTPADGVGLLLEALRKIAEHDRPRSSVRIGTVQLAGHGALRLICDNLPVEKDELYINPELDYQWTKDDGALEKLRAGEKVLLLTPTGAEQDQLYILVCKVVRP